MTSIERCLEFEPQASESQSLEAPLVGLLMYKAHTFCLHACLS